MPRGAYLPEISPATLRRFAWLAVLIVTLVLGAVLIFHPASGLLAVSRLRQERNQLRSEVQRLQSEKQTLQEQLRRLESGDPFVIEEEARRKGMVRQGEEVYRLRYQESGDSLNLEHQE